MLSMGEALELAKKNLAIYNASDWQAFRGNLTDDCVYREYGSGREIRGADEYVRVARAWKDAFPDVIGEITNAFDSGDQVLLQIMWKGTHTGELTGPIGTIPPTGMRQVNPACQVIRVRDGKVSSTDQYFDSMTLLTQLGVMEPAGNMP
jgi:steroid delta-isomerase-like uncharacterized protein